MIWRIKHPDGTQTVMTSRVISVHAPTGEPISSRPLTPGELSAYEIWAAAQPGYEHWRAMRDASQAKAASA